MVITAAHLSLTGEPLRFRVENSWGPDRGNIYPILPLLRYIDVNLPHTGDQGFFVMSADWFKQLVYQVVA